MPRIKAERCASNRSARRDADWCRGCGLHAHTHGGQHRADCTLQPPPCAVCLYHPAVHGGTHRTDCTKATP